MLKDVLVGTVTVLPIEHEIDKKLGMSAQDAVKQLGVKGYNDECRANRSALYWRMGANCNQNRSLGGFQKRLQNNGHSEFMESVWWVIE